MVKRTRGAAFIAGAIYFIQGTLGISGIALPLYLRSLHWSITDIASVTSLAALPWILKIFYGFLSDTYPLFGFRRKSYLIVFSLISAAGWFALAFLPTAKYGILFALMLSNLGFAATDVITDGFVVEHSSGVVSSFYQSIAWGFRSAGSVVGGILSGWLAVHWQPYQIFLLTMTLPITVCFIALLIRERKLERSLFHYSSISPFQCCIQLLAGRDLRLYALILFFVSVSSSFGVPLFFHMKESLGFSETFLGFLSSSGWAGAGLGSLIYVRFLRRISPRRTLRWAMIFNCFNILASLFIKDQHSALLVVIMGGVMGCLVMLPIASAIAAATHQSGVESTLFAILMSIFNVGQISFGFIGGKVFNVIGLVPLILVSGFMALAGLFFIRRLKWEVIV